MSDIHRHDISNHICLALKPHLPGSKGNRGRRVHDNRLFLNAVLWKLRTGCPWRNLPAQYGHWNTVWRRFRSWRDRGVWERLFDLTSDDPDLEWLMIDASHIKVHPHTSGAKGGTKIWHAPKAA